MNRAAFVVVLTASALWAANLFSQSGDATEDEQRTAGRAEPYLATSVQGQRSTAQNGKEHLQKKLRSLVESNSEHMSADELREVVRLMERLSVQPVFYPVVDQLSRTAEAEHSLAAYQARLAIKVLQTHEWETLGEVGEVLEVEPPSDTAPTGQPQVP